MHTTGTLYTFLTYKFTTHQRFFHHHHHCCHRLLQDSVCELLNISFSTKTFSAALLALFMLTTENFSARRRTV